MFTLPLRKKNEVLQHSNVDAIILFLMVLYEVSALTLDVTGHGVQSKVHYETCSIYLENAEHQQRG